MNTSCDSFHNKALSNISIKTNRFIKNRLFLNAWLRRIITFKYYLKNKNNVRKYKTNLYFFALKVHIF